MLKTIIGRKVGMTRLYDSEGRNVPVTIIQAGPCYVSQIKSAKSDGYDAVQMAYDPCKARNSTFPVIGHDGKAGLAPHRVHREMRVAGDELAQFQPGQELSVTFLDGIKYVDVTGTGKGKGFAGVMKRYHFGGLCASHGTERKHRSPGSIASHATNRGYSGRPKKGKKMPGQMGNGTVTIRSIEVIGKDEKNNLLLVKGAIPGPNQELVTIREAVRLYKRKAKKLAQAS